MPQKKPTVAVSQKQKPTILVSKKIPTLLTTPFPNPANELKVRGLAGTPQSRALMA